MQKLIWFLQKRRIFFGWVVVACGILVMSVTHGVVQNCFSLYIKPVTEALGFTRQGFSVCQTLTNVIYMGIALFSGKIFERFKVLGLMRIACIVLPAAYFCYSLCTQLWMFYAVSVVVGVATSFLTFLPFTLIISNWFEDRRGLAIGICFMGSGLGGMLFNALAGGWIEAFGWHAVFRILAGIQALVMIPILFLVLRVSPQEVGLQPLGSGPVASEGGSAPVYGLTLAQAMRSFRFWALIFTALIVGLTSTMLSNTIVPHLSDIGYAATYASGVMSCYMGLLPCARSCWAACTTAWACARARSSPSPPSSSASWGCTLAPSSPCTCSSWRAPRWAAPWAPWPTPSSRSRPSAPGPMPPSRASSPRPTPSRAPSAPSSPIRSTMEPGPTARRL